MKKITLLAALILLSCAPKRVQAQSNVLAPAFNQQFLDSNGRPVNAGKLCTYAAGTTTPLAAYSDSSGTLHTNPIILGSDGRLPGGLLYVSANSYKLELRREGTDGAGTCPGGGHAGATIKTWDNIKSNALTGGGWAFDGVSKIYPSTVTSDVLIGASTDADVSSPGSGDLHVVGTSLNIYGDSTANANELDIRVGTSSAITFEALLNGTATQVPIHWRDGCDGLPCMILDGSAGTAANLTLGSSVVPGVFSIVSPTSSSTYTAQGVTSNSVITTGGYFGTATGTETLLGSSVPLYVKRTSGTFAVFNDTAGTSGSLVLVTSNTSGILNSSTSSISIQLNSNATGNSPVITAGVYTASLIVSGGGSTGPGFMLTDANKGIIFLLDSAENAATTGLMVWHNGTLQRVGLGAADSGGAGFRLMRVLN